MAIIIVIAVAVGFIVSWLFVLLRLYICARSHWSIVIKHLGMSLIFPEISSSS